MALAYSKMVDVIQVEIPEAERRNSHIGYGHHPAKAHEEQMIEIFSAPSSLSVTKCSPLWAPQRMPCGLIYNYCIVCSIYCHIYNLL